MKKQQGDIIIKVVDRIPKGAKRRKRGRCDGYIIHEGELTGHAHRLYGEAQVYEYGDEMYLKADSPVELRHEEHKPIVIPSGLYTIKTGLYTIKSVLQYDHFDMEAKKVLD